MEGTLIDTRLLRFLSTVAKRGSIARSAVAALVIDGVYLLLEEDNSIPSRETEPSAMDSALCMLADELGLVCPSQATYLGFRDSDGLRTFYFRISGGIRSGGQTMKKVGIVEAGPLLPKGVAELLKS